MGYWSWSTILLIFAAIYVYFVFRKLYELMNPLHNIIMAENDPTIDPLWLPNTNISLVCFLSTSPKFIPFKLSDIIESSKILVHHKGIQFSSKQSEFELNFNITRLPTPHDEEATNATNHKHFMASPKIWSQLESNKTSVHLHVLIIKQLHREDEVTRELIRDGDALYGIVEMVKYDKVPKHFAHRYLLSDFGLVPMDKDDTIRNKYHSDALISYWKPEVAVRLVTDFSEYPYSHVPEAISKNTIRRGKDSRMQSSRKAEQSQLYYKPPVHVDEIGLTSDKYIPLNRSVEFLPLKISYAPMPLQRWLLMSNMEEALKSQTGIGFADKDIDDVRRLISDTSVYLLAVTMIASILHLLFEFLAFQSDINFWKTNQSLAGLSTRSVITELFSQIIIFLYLIDKETSLLVVVPSFFSILIQLWKVKKATGISLAWSNYCGVLYTPTIIFRRWQQESSIEPGDSDNSSNSSMIVKEDALTKATLEADRIATSYLSMVLLPVALSFIGYSLVYEKHASWYSFAIGGLTGVVYTFGFILMCPQLFINHQLKSVSHLPWKFLIFRFLNTFIDDLFAFIIKMPTMHRLSVFRDDIVFIIYIYQRWIYAVDTSRPTEQ